MIRWTPGNLLLAILAAATLCADVWIFRHLFHLLTDGARFGGETEYGVIGFVVGQGSFWLIVLSIRRRSWMLWLPMAVVVMAFGMYVFANIRELSTNLKTAVFIAACLPAVLPNLFQKAAEKITTPSMRLSVVLGGLLFAAILFLVLIYGNMPSGRGLIEPEIILFGAFISLFSGTVLMSPRYHRSGLYPIVLGATCMLSYAYMFNTSRYQPHTEYLLFFTFQTLYLWFAGFLLNQAERLDESDQATDSVEINDQPATIRSTRN